MYNILLYYFTYGMCKILLFIIKLFVHVIWCVLILTKLYIYIYIYNVVMYNLYLHIILYIQSRDLK